MEAYTQV